MNDPKVITYAVGSLPLMVTMNDGSSSVMTVRKIPVRSMGQLVAVWSKEEKEVDVYLGQSDGFSEGLSDGSFVEVIELGRSLNVVEFTKYAARRKEALKAMGVDLDAITTDLIAKVEKEEEAAKAAKTPSV